MPIRTSNIKTGESFVACTKYGLIKRLMNSNTASKASIPKNSMNFSFTIILRLGVKNKIRNVIIATAMVAY